MLVAIWCIIFLHFSPFFVVSINFSVYPKRLHGVTSTQCYVSREGMISIEFDLNLFNDHDK